MPQPLIRGERLTEDLVIVRIMAELDVSPQVPSEPGFVDHAGRQPASALAGLQYLKIADAKGVQPVSGSQPGRATPKNQHATRIAFGQGA